MGPQMMSANGLAGRIASQATDKRTGLDPVFNVSLIFTPTEPRRRAVLSLSKNPAALPLLGFSVWFKAARRNPEGGRNHLDLSPNEATMRAETVMSHLSP